MIFFLVFLAVFPQDARFCEKGNFSGDLVRSEKPRNSPKYGEVLKLKG